MGEVLTVISLSCIVKGLTSLITDFILPISVYQWTPSLIFTSTRVNHNIASCSRSSPQEKSQSRRDRETCMVDVCCDSLAGWKRKKSQRRLYKKLTCDLKQRLVITCLSLRVAYYAEIRAMHNETRGTRALPNLTIPKKKLTYLRNGV